MSKSNFKGVFVPSEIIRNDRLTATDKFLLAYIINFKDGCFASDKYIAETLGVGAKTVRNSLTKLRSLKLIISASIDGKRRLVCPEIGTSMSLNKDTDVPKSGQVCPEIGNRQQRDDPCSNNNSKTNSKTNSSSNSTTTMGSLDLSLVDRKIIEFQKYHFLNHSVGIVNSLKQQLYSSGLEDDDIVLMIDEYFERLSDEVYSKDMDKMIMRSCQRPDFLLIELYQTA